MIGIVLPACSIFFSCLLCIIYFFKKRINLIENSMYSIMIMATLFDGILVTILQTIAVNSTTGLQNIFLVLFNKIDFILLILYASCLFFYIVLITFPKIKENFKKFFITFGGLSILFSMFVLVGQVEIITSSGNFAATGSAVTGMYILCAFYILSSILIVLTHIKKIDKRHIPIFAILLIIPFLFVLYNLNPYLIIISITLTFINYIMFFTIENPDVQMIEQLNIAKDQADKANQAKTEFLSSMSHEIRTPLNAIVGFSECMLPSTDLAEIKGFAKDIVDASHNLLEIVNGILDISKIEANKMEIITKEYNPREVFNSLCKLVKPRIGDKPIAFNTNISPDLPGILKGDMGKVKQIILNLLTNAAKYTDKGEIEFNVTCVNRQDTKKCLLYIAVKDTGRGIKKEDISKLFNKFERIDEDRNTTIEGTGLGLAITKSLAEMMGGKITVDSKFESGSVFRVYLEQEIISMEIPEDKTEEIEIDYTANPGKRILIVDDSKINLKVANQILKPYNFNVKMVESGFEALELMESQTFDLILMDIMMPKMNGVETLRRLKLIDGFDIPVIALTADAIEGTDEKYLNAGFDAYLSKPIDRYELDRVLKKYLGGNENE